MSSSSLFPDLPSVPEEVIAPSGFGTTRSLYRKYRPQTFDASELVGQEAIVRTLRNAIKLDRVAHAYLFTGPRGTGKTTTARLLAKAVNCLDPDPDTRPCNRCAACVAINSGSTTDIIEIDAASNRGIDDIRELRERVKFAPTFLRTKFYIVDEAHQITGAAANAFLKTLEEPPPHTKFILATTDPEQLLPTIVSRCQRFDFKRFDRTTLIDHLARVAQQENIPIDRDALAVIGEHAGGSMRDALGILDQLASYRKETNGEHAQPIGAEDVRNLLGVARGERVVRLVHALADADAGAGLAIINEAFEAGEDPRQLNRQLVSLLRSVMFQVAAGSGSADQEIEQLAVRFSLGVIARHAARFSEIDYRIRHASLPQLPLEIAFVQAAIDAGSTHLTPEMAAPRTQSEMPTARSDQHTARRRDAGRATTESAPRQQRQPDSSPQARQAVSSPPAQSPEPPCDSDIVPGSEREPAVASRLKGELTVDLLHDLWPKIRLDVKARDRRIEALLSSCDPAGVDGNAIKLVTSYKFHWEKMNEEATQDLVRSVIGRLVDRPVTVTTEMRGAAPTTPVRPTPSSAQPPIETVDDRTRATLDQQPAPIERSPEAQTVIEAARNIFDAEEITRRS